MGRQITIDCPEDATPLDPNEMEGLKFKHITNRKELDHLEQANIEAGLTWVKRKRKAEVLTEYFIRTLHKKLFGDVWQWAGRFRQTEKNIGIDPIHISIQLRLLLDDIHFWIEHKTYIPQEIAARFHHKLVYIHLFQNGNGRHARIMTDLLLTHEFGLNEIDWLGGFDLTFINERRKSYITALKQADQGDYRFLLTFIGL